MNRLTLTTATLATAALLALAGTGTAFADTTADTSASTSQPGSLSITGSPARPGQTVTFDGTCASSTGPTYPTVGGVTSSAFSKVSMDRTNPDAFDGTATIATTAAPGTHTVTARCSNGAISTTVTVIGTHVTPNHGGGTTGGSGTHSSTRSSATQVNQFDTLVDEVGSSLPWLIGAIALIALAGGGAYALGRGRREDRAFEADRRSRQDWEAYQAWKDQQDQQAWQRHQGPRGPRGPRGPMSYR